MCLNGKYSACSAGDTGDVGSILALQRSIGRGNGNPFQYSCLENSMDRGAWWAAVHGITKSRTRLSDFTYLLTMLLIFNSTDTFGTYCVIGTVP